MTLMRLGSMLRNTEPRARVRGSYRGWNYDLIVWPLRAFFAFVAIRYLWARWRRRR